MREIIRERLAITHLIFLLFNLLVAIDFWQTHPENDTIVAISENLTYNSGQSWDGDRQLGTYEVQTSNHTFEVSKQYGRLFEEDSAITIYCTKFLNIVRSVATGEQIIPIAFWLYIIFALAAIFISATALYLRHNVDFRVFTAVISGILSVMVIYIIWL